MRRFSIFNNGTVALSVCSALVSVSVDAASEAPAGSTSGALMQGLLGLGMVLAALAAFFWFLRRFSPGQNAAHGAVKVIGGVMLGPRERLVVVEVGETWLLLGIGGGQVSTLHTLPRPEGYQPEPPGAHPGRMPDFADKLRELLSKRSV